jgi:hypothetical protein
MLFIYYFVMLYCIYDISICIYIECEFVMSSCTPVCLRLYKKNLVLSVEVVSIPIYWILKLFRHRGIFCFFILINHDVIIFHEQVV